MNEETKSQSLLGEEEEDGGEHTNAVYYERFWTKPRKARGMKLEKTMLLRNLTVSLVEDLVRLHDERIHSRHRPLLRRQFARQRR